VAAGATMSLAFSEVEKTFFDKAVEPQKLSLVNEVGTSPCIFKLGDSFYDFTPVKVVQPNPSLPYFDGNATLIPTHLPQYNFTWGWCQQINEISTAVACKQDIFAGRVDFALTPTADMPCMPYSGGDPFNDIETEAISGIPATYNRMKQGLTN